MRQVVVTGLGVVTAIGQGIDEFGAALKAGRSGIKSVSTAMGLPLNSAALLTDFDVDTSLSKIGDMPDALYQRARAFTRRAPLPVQSSVVTAVEAWHQAQLTDAAVEASRISLVVAGQNLNQRYGYDLQQKYHDTLEYLPPRYGVHFLDTDQVGVVSELLGIRGEGLTVGGASASGNVGLIQGSRLIQWGVADVCVVIGAMMDLSPLEVQAFQSLGALGGKTIREAEKACRPFDQAREGFIYGQGSGCLILENETLAKQRGIRPWAKLVGSGLALDGNRLTDPNATGEARAMKQALHAAEMSAADVEYINTHGTASLLGDEAEIAAIRELFGDTVSQVWLNSTKSLTGHCLSAAGVVEAIATLIQMKEGFVHPNLNLDQPLDKRCRFAGRESQPAAITIALSNSFGFGGINSSIVLRNG